MIQAIKNLFGLGPKVDYKELVKNGAIIIDVRSPNEFQYGHIQKSVNIPLQSLGGQLGKIDKNKVVITCCASGMRSASAKSILKAKGYSVVHNGGAWQSLESKIK